MSSWNQQSQPQMNNNMMMGQAQFTPYWGINPQYPQTGNYTTAGSYGRQQAPVYKADPIYGENAAWQFPMGPNSEIYLPDADEDIIWWIRTDANGNKNVQGFDVVPHKKPEQVNLNDLVARLGAVEEWINAKSNKSNAKRNAATAASPATSATVE